MSLDNVRIVLVSPLYGGNVGAVCRVMRNMGLADLALVRPRPFDIEEARMMARWATDVLEARRVFPTLADAVADCGLVFGTTARPGLYRQHTRTPREWAPRILEAAATGRVALVFGPEDNGLPNEDLALCGNLIRIPSTESYTSLNLSHAVLVCAYELYVASGLYEPTQEKSAEAPSSLRERMYDMWRVSLLEIGFMKEDKADHMMMGVRRILSRGRLTEDDVRILMGISRQMRWCARRMKEGTQST